ncbi:hypothetical protein J1N35_019235 [Gossypium stocksii]|uniref:Uncharacterized protein n=1 Tax=Gossypium stocksii TaxID=47602 RepID=A0A9D3VS70_9ROSI|nr:hypothetical protein J1N35_019235 [Gossypium stocksii]
MNTTIRLTLEEFGNLLLLPPEGNYDEKCHYNPDLNIKSGLTSKLNIHDHVLYLIITWNLCPIKKHAKLCNTDYWWIDSVDFDRRLDLALIRRLGISTLRDTLISSNQPISNGALHHVSYHYNANSSEWIKSGHPVANEDDDTEGAFEDFPAPEHVPPPTISSHAAKPSSNVNVAILHALHFLSNFF